LETPLKLICLDLDGVIYIGDFLIDGALFFIEKLRENNIQYLFVTNSTLRSRDFYAQKLNKLGIPAKREQIITAAYATAKYIQGREKDRSFSTFILGEEGLKQEFSILNCNFLTEEDSETSDYVVVGLDRDINYKKICKAVNDLLKGAHFIGVNNDALWPTENGLMPGVGVFVAALKAACKREPYIVGKPNIFMLKLAMQKVKVKPYEVLMVGDKLDSDILMGNKARTKTALVLTGVTSKEEALKATGLLKPAIVVENLYQLWKAIEKGLI